MSQSTYALPDAVKGSTWDGVPSIAITGNAAILSNDLSRVRVHVRVRAGAPDDPEYAFDSDDGSVSIDDASGWEFSIPKAIIDLHPRTYYYDIELTASNGDVKKWIKGTWRVLPEVTT